MFHSTKFSILPPVVKNLLIINLLVFLATIVLRDSRIIDLNHILAWHGAGSTYPFQIWQPITYMFMHGDFYHIFFNMFGIWMFGTQLENVWGSKRFLNFYLLTGLGAGCIHFLLFDGSLIGASGAFYGLLFGFGIMFPNAILMLIFPPIPIKAKYFVIIMGIIEMYRGLTSTGNIAHFAHLGGALFAFLIIKYWQSQINKR